MTLITSASVESSSESHREGGRALAIDHLRAVLILLVVAHHAVLAYVSFAPPPGAGWNHEAMAWRAFPVVDTVRAPALDLLAAFNDVVLMALLFFLAGLFTWRALSNKGAGGFLLGRARRLGLPFLVSSAVLAPLAYYPAYLQHGGEPGARAYWKAWTGLSVWPSGPAWFLWVLLAFSAFAALGYRYFPHWGDALGKRLGPIGRSPWAFYGLLVAASSVVYVPVAAVVNPIDWFEFGPFAVQTSRISLYALYFVFGIGLGAYGVRKGLLSSEGRLAKKWMTWQGVATLFFFVMLACVIAVFSQIEKGALHPALPYASSLAFMLSCAASSFMLLSMFLRFAHWTSAAWRSLAQNAYGIYLVHYVFVSWLQFAALDLQSSAGSKALVVFLAAMALSWFTSIALRRIPAVARVI